MPANFNASWLASSEAASSSQKATTTLVFFSSLCDRAIPVARLNASAGKAAEEIEPGRAHRQETIDAPLSSELFAPVSFNKYFSDVPIAMWAAKLRWEAAMVSSGF